MGPTTGQGARNSHAVSRFPTEGVFHRAVLALVLVVAAMAYLPAVGGEFHWDDDVAVLGNPRVVDLSLFRWRDFLPPAVFRDRPLTDLSFAVNHATSGSANAPFVLTNITIHLAAAWLSWWVARRLLRRVAHPRAETLALVVAGAFALHPLQTEAVSFVCQRAESLASALYLGAMALTLRAEERYPQPGWGRWLAGAAVVFLLAMAAKAMAVTFPLLFLILAWTTGARSPDKAPFRRAAMSGLLAAAAIFGAWILVGLRGLKDAGLDAGDLGPWRYLLTEGGVIVRYLALVFWPSGQSVDHFVRGSTGLLDLETLLSVVLLCVLLLGAAWLARRARLEQADPAVPIVAAGVLWYFIVLGPTSSLVPLADPMAEHRVYLANVGLFLAMAAAGDWGWRRLVTRAISPRIAATIAVLGAGLLTAALVDRNRLWRSDLALWEDAARKAPLHYRPQMHLASALAKEGDLQRALTYYRRAAELIPPLTELWARLQVAYATALGKAGRMSDGVSLLQGAIARAPAHVALRESLAWLRYSAGDLDGAVADAERGRQIAPNSSAFAGVLGKSAATRGDLTTALRELRSAMAFDPRSALRRSDLAIVSKMAGLDGEACAELTQFVALEKEAAARADGLKLMHSWACSR